MKIKSMTATFGKLDKARLEPGPGLNLISAPNEGGKSTWAAFWRAMLYGIDTRDRDKKGYLADKNRYQPWSGAPMEGEIQLEWQGRDITIRRGPRGNTPFGSFSAVYTATEEPVPGLTAANCGELLTGASLPVFSRSAFIGADNLSLTSAPELERRIAALVSSGDEDVSFSQVQARLKDWLNKRKVNKSVGEIPRLEGELSQVRDELLQLEGVTGQISLLEAELHSLEGQQAALLEEEQAHQFAARTALQEKISALEEQQQALLRGRAQLIEEENLHRLLVGQELNRRYTLAYQEWESARHQLESLTRESIKYGSLPDKERLKKAQGEMQYLKVLDEEIKSGEEALSQAEEAYIQAQINAQDEHFTGQSAQEAAAQVQKAQGEYTMCMDTARAKALGAKIFPIVGLAAALAGGIYAFVQSGTLLAYPTYAGLFILTLTLLATAINLMGVKSWNQRAGKSLAHYGVETPQALDALLDDYIARCQKADEAAQQSKAIRGALNDQKARRDNSWADLLEFVHTFAPEVQNTFGCSAALSRGLNLEHEIAAVRERVEERRRRLDDLAAQGGQLEEHPQAVGVPQHSVEEIRSLSAQVSTRLEQVAQAIHQAQGQLTVLGSAPDGSCTPGRTPCRTPCRTPQETSDTLSEVLSRMETVRAELNQARGRQRAMGDPAALAARQEYLSNQLSARSLEYDALTLAMDTLQHANARLQERFSPELNRLAGEYMAQLTGNKYSAVSLTRELEGAVRQEGEVLPHSALYLSRGTADQLYLAVRLAVCRLCLPEKPPVFLDDALAAFDDQRLLFALELLQDLAEEQQILLFSCHSREQVQLPQVPNITKIFL